jgi:site-specific DNA-methyltransferase (adenine-specific)
MAFADPPDNIGLGYDGYDDKIPDFEYEIFLQNIIKYSTDKCDVLWLSLNSRHTFMAGHVIHKMLGWLRGEWEAKSCVQTFTFGQHNHRDLGNNHRLLYRLMKTGTEIYPDAIRVPSWRQLNGDKRADPRGRVPGDVFDFPRVTGNSKQRRAFSPTQLHEGLYVRCIQLCCAPGNDTVVDLFAGSGTLGRVAPACGVDAVMVELSKTVCEQIAADQGIKKIW